ncbi:hypothetical protein [Nonomuraea sp. NPDC050643]|uniref:hypothetical protein n=1 Tax=Nonomuraea sp. NPDC050643 TaxID=3155660 RepID=UPI0033D9A945
MTPDIVLSVAGLLVAFIAGAAFDRATTTGRQRAALRQLADAAATPGNRDLAEALARAEDVLGRRR